MNNIKKYTWVGNYFSDRVMFATIHEYVTNGNNTVHNKATALRIMSDKGMGVPVEQHMTDAQLVDEYIKGV